MIKTARNGAKVRITDIDMIMSIVRLRNAEILDGAGDAL
jgi:hypothetical protein